MGGAFSVPREAVWGRRSLEHQRSCMRKNHLADTAHNESGLLILGILTDLDDAAEGTIRGHAGANLNLQNRNDAMES